MTSTPFYQFKLKGHPSGLEFDIELDPNQRLYCLIGENGSGKTSLLEALASVMFWLHAVWRRSASQEERGGFTGLFTRTELQDRFRTRTIRVSSGDFSGRAIRDTRGWTHGKLLSVTAASDGAAPIDRPVIFVPAGDRAALSGIGASALSLVGNTASVFSDTLERTLNAIERKPIDSTTVAMWFASRLLVNPNFVVGIQNRTDEVAVILQLLEAFDSEHFGGIVTTESGNRRFAIAFSEGHLLFMGRPIDRLASGYTALLKILQEIVSSIAAWEAMRNRSDLLATDAIILIDEIDAHLHPRWQKKLLPFLKAQFPNALFVVTTHSALIARDTDQGEAYELIRKDKVTARKLGSPRDWYFSDVLADAFHVNLPLVGSELSTGEPSLIDPFLSFSSLVERFNRSKDESVREQALILHKSLSPRLSADDPRQSTLNTLRGLLG